MADQALISLPKKALKKIIREGKLSALIASDEGSNFFDSYMISHPEFKKYWDFFNTANNIVNVQDSTQKIELARNCFDKHIAIEADSNDRVDACLKSRSAVDNIEKAIINQDSAGVSNFFQSLKDSALEILDQKVFQTLIPQLVQQSLAKSTTCTVV